MAVYIGLMFTGLGGTRQAQLLVDVELAAHGVESHCIHVRIYHIIGMIRQTYWQHRHCECESQLLV